MKVSCCVALFFFCLTSVVLGEDSRIILNSYINGQSVKLIFDTGAEGPALFQKTADRLNLSIQEPPKDVQIKPGLIKLRLTEECQFQLNKGDRKISQKFAVIDTPAGLDLKCDGILCWAGVKHLLVELDSDHSQLKIGEIADFDRSKWESLDIRTDTNFLILKLGGTDDTQDLLLLDTGNPNGLEVRNELWRKCFGDSSDQNTTLLAMYSPGVGLTVSREKWAPKIDIGGFSLNHTPVEKGLSNAAIADMGIDGVVGMWALAGYNWIIDGANGKIYFRKNELVRIPQQYDYNRLGAVFVPKDIQTSNALVGHVIPDSPAYKAGIRDGDELLRIGSIDVTKWRTDPNVLPLSRFWEKSAGTKMDLLVNRNGEKIEITATLEEIFSSGEY